MGTATFSVVPGLLLLVYLTDTVGAAPALAGGLLLVAKVWDVVIDPALGAWSDRSAAKRGSRRPWLLLGGATLPLAFAAMFAVPYLAPSASPTGHAVLVTVAFMVAATAYSVFQIPYVGLPAEMTDDTHGRTRIVAWRMVLLSVGILLAGALAPAVRNAVADPVLGYLVMGLAVAALLAVAMLGCWWGTRRIVFRQPTADSDGGLRAQWTALRANPRFLALLAFYVVQSLAVASMLAGAQYVATYRLNDVSAVTPLFAALIGPAVLAVPVWARAARRFGKYCCLLVASLGYAAGAALLAVVAAPGRVLVTCAVTALLGVAYAAMQLLPFSLLADAVAEADLRSGTRRAGTFTGIWTAGETTGAALGPAIYAAVLAVTGFRPSTPTTPVVQPDSALTGVLIGFTLVPAALLLLSLPLLRLTRRSGPRETVSG